MQLSLAALVLGGIVPAILYGVSNVLVKGAERAGIGVGPLIAIAGITVTLVGITAWVLLPDRGVITVKSGGLAALFGIVWALGSLAVALALSRYGAPLAQLVPVYNTNTLVAVLIALVVFGEWKQVQPSTLLVGACLILIGSVLVVRS